MTTEELKNAAGFKAVDAEGNELGVVSLSDIVSAVKQELQPSGVARASVAALSEVSAQAATDTYEDQLPQKTDVTWIRGLDESGNPILISKQSLVSVAEGLMPIGYIEYRAISSSGLKITLSNIAEQSFVIEIFGNNISRSNKCTIFASPNEQSYRVESITSPIKYLKKVENSESIDLYLYHNGVFLSYGVHLNGSGKKDIDITIIRSESDIPSNATTISPL